MKRDVLFPGRRILGAGFALFIGLLVASAVVSVRPRQGNLNLTSAAFKGGEVIPAKYTCTGSNVSPPLAWSGVPRSAKSLVLVLDDPGAPSGMFNHWLVYNLPVGISKLPEEVPASATIFGNALQGLNDLKKLGYSGPCPARGKMHQYYFRLFALDTVLDLKPGATRKEVAAAMQKHVLAEAHLVGTCEEQ